MKRKINGKTYDTDAEKAIAIYCNDQPDRSMYHFHEVLYIKADGEYFIHGSGGALTHYAKKYSNRSNASGEAIIPMTVDQAREWTKRSCAIEVYRELFGENAE